MYDLPIFLCFIEKCKVVDNNMRIRYVDGSHGGSTHDASIWATSLLRPSMEQDYLEGHRRFWLLGMLQ